jgi:hypothetical protein
MQQPEIVLLAFFGGFQWQHGSSQSGEPWGPQILSIVGMTHHAALLLDCLEREQRPRSSGFLSQDGGLYSSLYPLPPYQNILFVAACAV